jgi:hypothetical protein
LTAAGFAGMMDAHCTGCFFQLCDAHQAIIVIYQPQIFLPIILRKQP